MGTGVSVGLLARNGWWLMVPAATLLLAWLSYRGAVVAAAIAYGEAIEAAFDLHRFDLLRALHLPLPSDLAAEVRANQQLTRFLHQPHEELFFLLRIGKGINFTYDHDIPEPVGQQMAGTAAGDELSATRADGTPIARTLCVG